ncbi:MAG: hypothetical protein QOH21_3673, partial [Acidobacteriota bacterium]|nr:hypothetical protein [Acidobacteriota bacterium]
MSVDKETLDGLRIQRAPVQARRSAMPWWAIALVVLVLAGGAIWLLTRN